MTRFRSNLAMQWPNSSPEWWNGPVITHSPNPETCSLCERPALNRVGNNGFCKTHRAEAEAATAATKGQGEIARITSPRHRVRS
jgi:hypothetical protein